MFGTEVNLIAVLLGGVAAMAIGYAWYSPALFAKQWMKLNGLTKEKIEGNTKDMPKTYGLTFVMALVASYILGVFIELTAFTTLLESMQVAFMGWLGFTAYAMMANYMFVRKPLNLWLIDTGYYLATFLAMGAIHSLLM